MSWKLLTGDALTVLATLPAASVQCCVTSPPYWGLRDYGVPGQLGLERTPEEYVAALVAVFRELRRVLRDDGTLWLNLGDSYANNGPGSWGSSHKSTLTTASRNGAWAPGKTVGTTPARASGLKPKDLVGIPWRVAFALQADGWWLRSDIIWAKPNPMPESVTDRPTKSHEYLFLLSKSARYYYDAEAIREEAEYGRRPMPADTWNRCKLEPSRVPGRTGGPDDDPSAGRNARTVWTIATQPFSEAHFATFPCELARRCIAAGTKPGDTVLDPFAGAGTTLLVTDRLQRDAIGIELNPAYAEMAERRIRDDAPLFAGENT